MNKYSLPLEHGDSFIHFMEITQADIAAKHKMDIGSVKAVMACCEFRVAMYQPTLFSQFGVVFPIELGRAVEKRQAEFLAGRSCAKQALRALGSMDTHVAIGDHRAPVWPQGVVGSITHSEDVAMCAVSLDTENDFVGIDVEPVMSLQVASDIRTNVLSFKEERILAQTGMTSAQYVTLAFSAKESLFKAIFPYVGEYMGFETSEIVAISKTESRVDLKLLPQFAKQLKGKHRFTCHYQLRDNRVLTQIVGQFQE